MANRVLVNIKRQPHDPPFVVRIGEQEVCGDASRADPDTAVVRFNGLGTFKVDAADVGYWFVEKEGVRCESASAARDGKGGLVGDMLGMIARAAGEHCGAVGSELSWIRRTLFGGR